MNLECAPTTHSKPELSIKKGKTLTLFNKNGENVSALCATEFLYSTSPETLIVHSLSVNGQLLPQHLQRSYNLYGSKSVAVV